MQVIQTGCARLRKDGRPPPGVHGVRESAIHKLIQMQNRAAFGSIFGGIVETSLNTICFALVRFRRSGTIGIGVSTRPQGEAGTPGSSDKCLLTSGETTGAAASQCVTPRGVRQFGGL